jgi:hypothetical protein
MTETILVDPELFPYEHYLQVREKRQRFLDEWWRGLHPRDVPVVIFPVFDIWNANNCYDRERQLGQNLYGMQASAEWPSDDVFPFLEPWYGVGVFATAFGAPYILDGESPPQTRPIFTRVDEVQNLRTPHPGQSPALLEVLDRIGWLRKVTHDRLPICLTDTQSPNDTASLLMETNEFFASTLAEPERLAPLLDRVTDLIIAFTEMQMEAIGLALIQPGHQMISLPGWRGISISDDNMAFLSPRAYAATSVPYNGRLGAHFGGVALHSCGSFKHNIPAQLHTTDLTQVECAVCYLTRAGDPNPNPPEALRDGYRGTGVLVKARLDKSEVELLDRLLAPDLKVLLQVGGIETRAEAEQVYRQFKERIARITAAWPTM